MRETPTNLIISLVASSILRPLKFPSPNEEADMMREGEDIVVIGFGRVETGRYEGDKCESWRRRG
jgi:hypothetical protein